MTLRYGAAALCALWFAAGGMAQAQSEQMVENVKMGLSRLGMDPSVVDTLSPDQISAIEGVVGGAQSPDFTQEDKRREVQAIIDR